MRRNTVNKAEIKKSIQEIINRGLIEDSIILINEYKKNFDSDEDIYSMEAINIYNENFDEAMLCLREGLKYNIFSSDIYYTMGNIFEMRKDYNRAFLCYEQALFLCKTSENIEIIKESILNIKSNFSINVHKTSIIMLTYNELEYTKTCIQSIRNNVNKESYEIVVVDNNSTDGTVDWLKEQEDIKVIFNEENKGFPAGCNQGIKYAEKENDILLLNNDTVLMVNSIFNMRMALYSNESIGATGAVSNSVSYYQKVNVNYENFEDYIAFATNNNISNEEKYEQRNKLVGFAMLIKREVLEKIGYLDEIFTPGNYEDDDLSLRIVLEGYKLLLCWDSYIHHFGSVSFRKVEQQYLNLLKKNKAEFIKKWGFDNEEAVRIYDHCYEFIQDKEENILEISCGAGSNLLALKMKNSNNKLYGYEENKNLIPINKNNKVELIKDFKSEEYKEFFNEVIIKDYMWINEDHERINQVFNIINNENGNLLVIFDVLKDNIYELKEENVINIKQVCEKSGFELINCKYLHFNEKNVQCYLYFRKNPKNICIKENIYNIKLKFLLRRIEFGIKYNECDLDLLSSKEFTDEIIIELVYRHIISKVIILNYIAIFFFNNNNYERVLPYLEEAYKINEKDNDTLYNLSYVLNFFGQKDLALGYIERISEKNDAILELIDSIKGV